MNSGMCPVCSNGFSKRLHTHLIFFSYLGSFSVINEFKIWFVSYGKKDNKQKDAWIAPFKKHLQIAERKPCPKPPFCCEGHCYYFLLSWLRDIVSTCALHTTVWPDSAHFCHFGEIWQFCKCFFSIWQHIRHTLAYLLCHWVNFHCFKWLNIRQTI